MIRQSPESKWRLKEMPVKVIEMSAIGVPARMFWPGKEQARSVVAGITVLSDVSSRAPDMLYSSKGVVSRDIGKMTGIPPLLGRDISNPSNNSTSKNSKTSSTSSTSRSSSSKT
jgi:hypothetical protein